VRRIFAGRAGKRPFRYIRYERLQRAIGRFRSLDSTRGLAAEGESLLQVFFSLFGCNFPTKTYLDLSVLLDSVKSTFQSPQYIYELGRLIRSLHTNLLNLE